MPIRLRLTIFNALVIGAILILLGLGLLFLLRETLLSDLEETTDSRAEAASELIEDDEVLEEDDDSPGVLTLDEDEEERLTVDDVFIVVRDDSGNIVARSENFTVASNPSDGVWRSALDSGEPASGDTSLTEESPEYVRAIPVSPEVDEEEGDLDEEEAALAEIRVVEAGQSYAFVQETVSAFTRVLLVALGAAFLVSVAGAYLLARAALAPVGAVVSSAREIEATDLSQRLPVESERDELGELTTTINGLLARLEEAFARREATIEEQRRFASDASHELRTPLTSITGYARMLREWGLEDREKAGEGVDAIERESARMRGLVESLLMLTRGDEGLKLEVEDADLAIEMSEAVEAARPAAEGRVSLSCETPESEVRADFDRAKVRQVISILIDNAIRYTPPGGEVVVRARRQDVHTAVEVSDTGPGISEEQVPHLFERFYRADPARSTEGTGLGLSIAKQIANAHGGSIEVDSSPGKGSTFTLLLPAER